MTYRHTKLTGDARIQVPVHLIPKATFIRFFLLYISHYLQIISVDFLFLRFYFFLNKCVFESYRIQCFTKHNMVQESEEYF